jgi:hypothetical protein
MNRVYSMMITVCICMMVILPWRGFAQCNCVGADTLTQMVPIDTSDAPKVLITFNQYLDPTGVMGLACMSIQDTVTVVSSTLVRNKSVGAITNANFTVQVSAKITGPSLSGSSASNLLAYGPYDFGPFGTTTLPSDSVVMGPDTILNRKTTISNGANPAPYIGTGTVSDTLTFGGGALSDAGTTFDYSIRTKYWGTALITFYLCPQLALSNTIRNFTAVPNGQAILLQWIADNQQINTNYEIQISTDGKNFTSIGEAESDPAKAGTSSKYQYQYYPDQTNVGKYWFRVKETDASGRVTYSTILILSSGGDASEGNLVSYSVYPNPVTNSLVFQFNGNQTGRYLLELVNTAGQVVLQKPVTLTGTSQIRMDLSPQPVKGLYFLRTTDIGRNHSYVSKVFIQ